MATLKNSDREELLRKILTESFKLRFEDIREKATGSLRFHLEQNHPKFIELLNNPDCRQYLAFHTIRHVYIELYDDKKHSLCEPKFGKFNEMPKGTYRSVNEDYIYISAGDVICPACVSSFTVTEAEIRIAYVNAWSDYVEAYGKLSALLNSYKSREKFTSDFPEFARHLPDVPTKAKLPAIVVDDVRAELSKFGVK